MSQRWFSREVEVPAGLGGQKGTKLMVVKKGEDVRSSSIGAVYCFRGRDRSRYCEAEQMEWGIGAIWMWFAGLIHHPKQPAPEWADNKEKSGFPRFCPP